MKTMTTSKLMVVAALLSGCAGTVYEPIVDQPRADYPVDLASCREHARQTMGVGGGAATGAVVGAGIGLVVCSALGGRNCGRTATATGAMGAASGAGAGAQGEAQVIRNCLIGRGHRVLN
jgi:hypothetical protein